MATLNNLPLVVIVGPTASGKTGVAIRLAKQFSGEIICSDSRTIYKGMDIGTAKPSVAEREGIPHWGLDLVEPGEQFTAADFKKYALQKIDEIRRRGNLPIMVGGTGLYVDGVIFDYDFVPHDDAERRKLEAMSLEQLINYCISNNISLPENSKNKRHLIRAIERKNVSGKRLEKPIDSTIIVGITTRKEVLQKRIAQRTEQIFEDGVVDEAIMLGKKYGWENEAMTGNIYKLVNEMLHGTLHLEELKARNNTRDWQLAKRQLTWLRRNPFIVWKTLEEAETYVARCLAETNN